MLYEVITASAAFLRGYLELAGEAVFLPRDAAELTALLEFYILDRLSSSGR